MESTTDPAMLEGRVFYRLGEFTFDHKRKIVVFGLLSCIMMSSLMGMGADWAEGWGEDDVESIRAGKVLSSAFSDGAENTESHSFTFLVFHPTLTDQDSQWRLAIERALEPISKLEGVETEHSWQIPEEMRAKRTSTEADGFWSMTIITIEGDFKASKTVYSTVEEKLIIEDGFSAWRTDGIAISYTFDKRIQEDLISAEIVSGPFSLIILAVVFGTLIAALVPVSIGIMTVLAAMGVTIWLSNITDVTQYATNIISLIGIGVSIDYSLFLVNRFREEIGRGRDLRTAVAMSVATSGKAVFYSGLTVAIGLLGMLFFKNTSLPSLGIGGTLAVSIAMIYSVIFLPAVLGLLGHRINRFKVPYSMKVEDGKDGIWGKIATMVMNRPWAVIIPTLIILIGAGMPFLYAEFSLSSTKALPPDDESRIGMETISEIWPESSSNDAFVVFDLDGADPLSESNIRAFHAWMAESTLDEMVVDGFGIGRPAAGLDADQTVDFWLGDADEQTLAMREYLKEKFVSGDVTFHLFALSGSEVDPESRIHVQGMRQDAPGLLNSLEAGPDSEIFIGGFAAYSADNLQAISDALPMALTFIFGATMVLIFIQVRSIVIPIKAVVMNILSISASFGMMVVIFQWGYGAELLNFTPQPIDSVNPIILFCIVFGLSMDYEVLMLSRIHEEWERTGDNTLAVANGLQKTGRLITGAAAIMVVVFSAFGLSSVIILKQIGFGLALAILLDATVVRALVVPAAMRLMGKWNWWAPAWMSSSKNIEQIEKPEE